MYSEQQSKRLDAEYRQLLYMIKPLITNINDHYNLEHYRIWLERLSFVYPSEKHERNKYLLLLANQIHDNVLFPPFTGVPSKGLLPALGKIQDSILAPTEKSDVDPEQVQWSFMSSGLSQPQDNINIQQEKKPKTVPLFEKIGRAACGAEEKSETSSWCDLSEAITPTETDVEDNEGSLSLQPNEEVNRRPTQEELEALKMRMKDLLEVKLALRDTQCLTEGRKKTIETLQLKLAQMEQENVELKSRLSRKDHQIDEVQSLLDSQQKKFVELDNVKSKELHNYKERFTILRKKEVEYMQEAHKKELASLEQKQSSRISQLEAQIASYEGKMKEMKESNMSVIKEKDDQIQQLRSQLKVRSSQIDNEGNGEQYYNLKRCVSKLGKALHKNEKDYVKKLERLKQDLEVKEITSQMQLQTQRADLLIQNSAEKQEEFKIAINSLEAKYKEIVEAVQAHALHVKKEDNRVIENLKNLLQKNSISF